MIGCTYAVQYTATMIENVQMYELCQKRQINKIFSSHIFSCPIRTSLIASAVECAGFLYGWMVRGPSGCQGLDWTALTEAVSEEPCVLMEAKE